MQRLFCRARCQPSPVVDFVLPGACSPRDSNPQHLASEASASSIWTRGANLCEVPSPHSQAETTAALGVPRACPGPCTTWHRQPGTHGTTWLRIYVIAPLALAFSYTYLDRDSNSALRGKSPQHRPQCFRGKSTVQLSSLTRYYAPELRAVRSPTETRTLSARLRTSRPTYRR